MRTIKFRGKRVDNGEWVYGFYVIDPKGEHRIYWKPFDEANRNTYHFVIPESVGQYTGLKDKDGKEIHEGDILKEIAPRGNKYKIWREKGGLVINQFRDDFHNPVDIISFWSGTSDMQTVSFIEGNLQVMGNIHDNPELLHPCT